MLDGSAELATGGSIAPLSARRKMMEEPALGAGSFPQHALALNPNRDQPFVYRHFTDQRGQVVFKGYSLVDFASVRDQYARWYWTSGVRPGEGVGVEEPAGGCPPRADEPDTRDRGAGAVGCCRHSANRRGLPDWRDRQGAEARTARRVGDVVHARPAESKQPMLGVAGD